MKIQTLLPPLSISKYVSSIFVIENYNQRNDFILPLYANGSPTLVFNTAKSTGKNKNIDHLTLYGQTINPSDLIIKTDFTLIAYFLYPSALTSLFGIDAGELTDGFMELTFLKKAKACNLQEQLLNAPTLNFRLDLLNNFIKKLSENAVSADSKTEFAIKAINKTNGQISLQNIQCELGVTERTLQRLFETNIGISPKMYSRVCQFQAAFQKMNQNKFSKISDIAYEYGFADQSHFNRVFKEFTHQTPTAYLEILKSISIEI
jgi:AraC-like DNA-binding protein